MVDSRTFFTISTERLLLDSFSIKDGKKMFQMLCTQEVAYYLSGIYVKSLCEAYENINFYRKENGKDYYIAIRLWLPKQKGELIGTIIATRPKEENDSLDIAYFIAKEHRKKGYMIEAINAFVQIAKEAGFKKLKFEILDDNIASRKIMKRIKASMQEKIKEPIPSMLYVLNL